jgi:hypothetical protein
MRVDWFFEKVRQHHVNLMRDFPDSVASFFNGTSEVDDVEGPMGPPPGLVINVHWEILRNAIQAGVVTGALSHLLDGGQRLGIGIEQGTENRPRALGREDLKAVAEALSSFGEADAARESDALHSIGWLPADLVQDTRELQRFLLQSWREGYDVVVYAQ